jgi:hypothetical protein
MKWVLRIVALVGTTVSGSLSIALVAFMIYNRIETYRLFHKFPIYGFDRDLRVGAPSVLALAVFASLYIYLVRKMRPISK